MARPSHQTFQPKKLSASELRTPVEGPLKELPSDVWGEIHERRAAMVDRLHPFGEQGRRILLWRTARAALGALLVTWLLTPVGLDAWWAVALMALIYGAAMAWWRFSMFQSGALLAVLGFLLMQISGCQPAMIDGVLSIVFYFVCGAVIGIAEDLAASDGD